MTEYLLKAIKMRNGQETREKLLQIAYEQMHEHGFQGMRVDQVLKQANLHKGAFYHHFSSKTELGYAVLEKKISALMEAVWLKPTAAMDNPLTEIPTMLETLGTRATKLMQAHGCPLNNLALEMSNLDEGFRKKIDANFQLWIKILAKKFENAKQKQYVRNDIDSEVIARFVIAIIEGCISITKVEKTPVQSTACIAQLRNYLKTLQ